MFKKIIIAAVFVALIIVGCFVYVARKVPPKTSVFPTPNIPVVFSGKLTFESTLKKSDFNFPSQLPILDNQKGVILDTEREQIAKNLGFEGDPLTANDYLEGETFIYLNDQATLTVFSDIGRIEYLRSSETSAVNKQVSDGDLTKTALAFLKDNYLYDDELKVGSFVYLGGTQPEGYNVVEKSKARVIQVNLSPNVSSYPLVSLVPFNSPIYVRILLDGTVYSANFTKLSPTLSQTKYSLKTFEETIQNLDQAVLIDLDNGGIPLTDLSKDAVQKVTVKRVSLYYLLESPQASKIQPVYLLDGVAKVTGITEEVSAKLYISALKQ